MSLPEPKPIDEINQTITRILASEEYTFADKQADAISRGIGELFQEFISMLETWLTQVKDVHPLIFVLVLVGSSLALLSIAWWSFRRSRLISLVNNISTTSFHVASETQTAEELRLEAEAYAEQANYLQSIRCMFQAYIKEKEPDLVSIFGPRKAIATQTYQELRPLLTESLDPEPELDQILTMLEQGLYGDRLITQDEHALAVRILGSSRELRSK